MQMKDFWVTFVLIAFSSSFAEMTTRFRNTLPNIQGQPTSNSATDQRNEIHCRESAAAAGRVREYRTMCLGAKEYGIDILRAQEIRSLDPPTGMAGATDFILEVETCNPSGPHASRFQFRYEPGAA